MGPPAGFAAAFGGGKKKSCCLIIKKILLPDYNIIVPLVTAFIIAAVYSILQEIKSVRVRDENRILRLRL
ncbi:hypothetical protein SBDP1_810019 [Syntrophobacter sp. SbD1]|nr:hypothetical protein SBDP1_810019 [Syntrophobacter sp. SbD1]